MNTRLAQSGQIFPQIRFFKAIFEVNGQILWIFSDLFVAFMVLKTTVLITRFQCKNRFEKRSNLAWDINQKLFSTGGLVWLAKSQNIFEDILGQVGSFFKPIFALKPWDWDGRFEYN